MHLPHLTKKRLLIIVGTTFVIVLIVLPTLNQPNPPLPQPTQMPTPSQTTNQQPTLPPLTIAQVFPESGIVELGGTTNSITIFFDQPIISSTGKISVTPTHPIELKTRPQDPNMLIIQPQTPWKNQQTYTINLLPGLMSLDGKFTLKEKLELRYTMVEPQLPVFTPENKEVL